MTTRLRKHCLECGYLNPDTHNFYKCCTGTCPALSKNRITDLINRIKSLEQQLRKGK